MDNDEIIEKTVVAPNGQWALFKGKKEDVWKQTVAFLAHHKEPKYTGLHAHIQSLDAAKAGKPPVKRVLAPPHKPGSFDNEGHTTTGAIKQKMVRFPGPGHTEQKPNWAHRKVNVQEQHHWKWSGGKWNHTHTTDSGTGMNSKEEKKKP